jgi:predicted component of type VI protein secretion system
LRHRDGAFSLTDLDSHDGTFLNEGIARIARQMLKDNDVIRIGCVSLKFKVL